MMLPQSANHLQQFLEDAVKGFDNSELTHSDVAALLKAQCETPAVQALLAELAGIVEELEAIAAHWSVHLTSPFIVTRPHY